LYELAPVGYCTVSAAGLVVQANLTLASLLGVTRSELVARPPFSKYIVSADQDGWYLLRRRLLQGGPTQNIEIRLQRADADGASTPLWVHLSASLQQEQGAAQLQIAVSDISARKEAEENLQAKAVAEAATQAKTRFLANMSHEIRTPMNAILGTAHLMRRDGVTPRQAAQLERIQVAAEHLLSVIDDILDLTRIEAGRLPLALKDVSVAHIIERVVSIMQPQVQAKGLALRLEVDAPPQPLRGDPTRLAQALMNYVGNALKFTDSGSITLRACLLEEDAKSQLLRFEVADTGPGIGPQVLARLFTAFEQADASPTRLHGGTGLGLAITKELARCMGGEVGVSSSPGLGSCFWLTVRLDKSESAEPGSAAPDHESSQSLLAREFSGSRVLLVEDDPLSQCVAEEMLSPTGLVVALANNGAEAVALATQAHFDAILMDVQMPVLDGLEATRQIRRLPGKQQTPIVALSANAFAEDRLRCRQAGMTDFLAKPVLPEQLCAVLLSSLRQAARARAQDARPTDSAEAILARDYPGRRLLVVEDREEHRDLLRAFLSDVWSDIDMAGDGSRAIELASQNRYDLILMDVQMRPMNGLEATRRIRALPDGHKVQILGLTASVGVDDIARAKEAGMDDILRKVFGPEEPYQTILKAMRRT
jgi:PAS domain S-box-containing protein